MVFYVSYSSWPWWVIIIAWVVSLSTSLLCSYFIMLYGLKFGPYKSMQWLVAFFTGFFQSVTVMEPVKAVAIIALTAWLFGKPAGPENSYRSLINRRRFGEPKFCQYRFSGHFTSKDY